MLVCLIVRELSSQGHSPPPPAQNKNKNPAWSLSETWVAEVLQPESQSESEAQEFQKRSLLLSLKHRTLDNTMAKQLKQYAR